MKVIEMLPSSASVVAALRLFGSLKAGTPLLIASTPVRAAQPEAKERSTRNAPPSPISPASQPLSGTIARAALSAGGRLPIATRANPTTIVAPTAIMNR